LPAQSAEKGMSSHATDLAVYAKSSSLLYTSHVRRYLFANINGHAGVKHSAQ